MIHCLIAVLMILSLFVVPVASAQNQKRVNFSNAKDHWTFMGGYGQTHRGFGDTETRVQQFDAILQYGYYLTEEKGASWYKFRHKVLLELPFSIIVHPEDAVMTGFNVLAGWDFTASNKIIPYFIAGGGLVYTNLDIPGLGSEFNGNYQSGVGLHYVIDRNRSIDFNYRLHHISNAGTADPNEPLNSSKFLIGLSYLY